MFNHDIAHHQSSTIVINELQQQPRPAKLRTLVVNDSSADLLQRTSPTLVVWRAITRRAATRQPVMNVSRSAYLAAPFRMERLASQQRHTVETTVEMPTTEFSNDFGFNVWHGERRRRPDQLAARPPWWPGIDN